MITPYNTTLAEPRSTLVKDNPPYVERSSPHLRTRTPVATMPPVPAPAQASPSLAHTRTERPKRHLARCSHAPRLNTQQWSPCALFDAPICMPQRTAETPERRSRPPPTRAELAPSTCILHMHPPLATRLLPRTLRRCTTLACGRYAHKPHWLD